MELGKLDHVHNAAWDADAAARSFERLLGSPFREFGPARESGVGSLASAAGVMNHRWSLDEIVGLLSNWPTTGNRVDLTSSSRFSYCFPGQGSLHAR